MTPVNRVAFLSLAALLAVPILHAPRAHAQSAEAEALFRDGRKLIKQHKIAAGCDKIEASERLETSVGTLLNLGDCREKLGKLASAWAAFRKAESLAKRAGNDDKRQAEARRRAAALEPNLSNLVIEVGHKTEGLVIKRDGAEVDAGVWNTAVPIDPGNYAIIAEAPGYKPYRTTVTINYKAKRRVLIPALERETVPTRPETTVVAPATPVVVTQPRREPVAVVTRTREPSMWTGTRQFSVVLGIAGAAAVGGGFYYGSRSQDLQEQSNARCPLTVCPDPEGLRLNDRAQDAALRANVMFVGGGVALAAATVLWFVGAPDNETVIAPTVGRDQVGVSFAGSF